MLLTNQNIKRVNVRILRDASGHNHAPMGPEFPTAAPPWTGDWRVGICGYCVQGPGSRGEYTTTSWGYLYYYFYHNEHVTGYIDYQGVIIGYSTHVMGLAM